VGNNKYIRNIVVDDIDYKWTVNAPEAFVTPTVKIWRADSKVPIYEDSIHTLELKSHSVTPESIKKKIKELAQ